MKIFSKKIINIKSLIKTINNLNIPDFLLAEWVYKDEINSLLKNVINENQILLLTNELDILKNKKDGLYKSMGILSILVTIAFSLYNINMKQNIELKIEQNEMQKNVKSININIQEKIDNNFIKLKEYINNQQEHISTLESNVGIDSSIINENSNDDFDSKLIVIDEYLKDYKENINLMKEMNEIYSKLEYLNKKSYKFNIILLILIFVYYMRILNKVSSKENFIRNILYSKLK